MAEFTVTKHLAASPEKVFEYSSDFANAAERIGGIESVEMLTDGPVGVGTRFKETRIMFKKRATEEMEVKTFDAPNSYSIGAESCGSRFLTEIQFTENDGGTDVKITFRATPLSLFAKLMSFMMGFMMKSMVKCVEKDFDDLEKAIQADAA